MPELPEVETVRSDMERRIVGKYIQRMKIWNRSLRKPVATRLPALVAKRKVLGVERRAKYILVRFKHGKMGIHLGMSGTVRADAPGAELRKHDHIEWELAHTLLRYNDPRRFGMVFWAANGGEHPLIANSGVEPLSSEFSSRRLLKLCATRRQPIKLLLMDHTKIAGIGNIYASEILFSSRVSPVRPAKDVSGPEAQAIVRNTKRILRAAIKAGGSSLRNHAYGEGKPGYFQQSHKVYGRHGLPCPVCATPIIRLVQGQRATFMCPMCQ